MRAKRRHKIGGAVRANQLDGTAERRERGVELPRFRVRGRQHIERNGIARSARETPRAPPAATARTLFRTDAFVEVARIQASLLISATSSGRRASARSSVWTAASARFSDSCASARTGYARSRSGRAAIACSSSAAASCGLLLRRQRQTQIEVRERSRRRLGRRWWQRQFDGFAEMRLGFRKPPRVHQKCAVRQLCLRVFRPIAARRRRRWLRRSRRRWLRSCVATPRSAHVSTNGMPRSMSVNAVKRPDAAVARAQRVQRQRP